MTNTPTPTSSPSAELRAGVADPAIRAVALRREFTVRRRGTGRLRRERSTVPAVDGVDLVIEHGETVGFLGPNGAGKSTTLKMMTGILAPSGGEVTVCGLTPSTHRRRLARRVGVVFGQRSQLWWDLPLHDSFRLLRHLHDVPADDHRRRLAACRRSLELDAFLDTPVRQLSLGQRMRGEITAALLHAPQVLFLDEPSIGLDVVSKQALRAFVAELRAGGRTTVVLTTHDLDDIERLCPRLVVIDRGRVVHDGTAAQLHERYGSRRRVVAELDAPLDAAALARLTALRGVRMEHADVGAPLVSPSPSGRCRTVFVLDGVPAGELVGALAATAPGESLRDIRVIEPDIEEVVARLYSSGQERWLAPGPPHGPDTDASRVTPA